MSFLTTIPEELLAAAAQLQGIGTSLAAQNAAAAAPTTTIAPAAADPVSQLQAGIFGAYGTVYQQFAAEANQVQQQFVQTLGLSSNSYSAAEATNAAQAVNPVTDFLNDMAVFMGPSTNGSPFALSGNSANFVSFEGGNWASAMSCLIGMAGGGLVPEDWWSGAAGVAGDVAAADAGLGAAGASAGVSSVTPLPGGAIGGATMVGALSVPPSWATSATPVSGTVGALSGATLTSATSSGSPGIIPGMPGLTSGARNSSGFGAPRYGVKPIVMKKLGLAAV
ncbi:hypothetical protein A5660_25705 [Mycobacterium alsense]|uniref:PPE family protein, SVP subgroup n=1 Tax=Mycobacterium alsense TaxID=324058 RepID=UPI0007FC1B7C|nr:PE domain-containing protein [Mycobacterium alsense]OBJ00018.1 hypothetical protein A5660_25705 [Mycobacterium alsense]